MNNFERYDIVQKSERETLSFYLNSVNKISASITRWQAVLWYGGEVEWINPVPSILFVCVSSLMMTVKESSSIV